MAQRAIRTTLPDGRIALNNIIDKFTSESIQLVKIEEIPGGNSADGIIYFETVSDIFGTEWWKREWKGAANVKWFGATGDGVTDDTLALQAALSHPAATKLHFNHGTYCVSDTLQVNSYRSIQGEGNLWNSNSLNTVIKWIGEDSPSDPVIRISTTSVGVEPSTAVSNVKINNIVVDGNNLAGYCIYTAYMINDSSLVDVAVVNATVGGLKVEKAWYATFERITARSNGGFGISFGREGWGGINGCKINNIQARANGTDQTFDPANNAVWGYGIGLFQGADLIASNVVAEQNYGPGMILRNNAEIAGFRDVYLEANCTGFSENWGILYEGMSNGRGHFLENIYCWGAHTSGQTTQWLRLQGSSPTGTLRIKNMFYGRISAEIDTYTVEDVGAQISQYIVGQLPRPLYGQRINGRNNFTTVYVRDDGDDGNTGDSALTAVATLGRAIQLAERGSLITTINCADATIHEPQVVSTRDITIDGGGTGVVTNTVNGRGLNIDTNGFTVRVTNFNTISRVIHNGKGVLQVDNSTVATTDGQNSACVTGNVSIDGITYLEDVILSGSSSQHAAPTSMDVRRKIIAQGVTTSGFITAHIRMHNKISSLHTNQSISQSNINWVSGGGVVMTEEAIYKEGASINFS